MTGWMRHGLRPYGWAPGWLNLYWPSPALFDVLAAVFLLRGERRGISLSCAVVAIDLAANWYAVYGLQRLGVFTAIALGTAPFTRRLLPR
ncbi:hypothetical protein [Streptomyces sp. NPDC096068]|uniref:hypothetical protein n=1 Tax=Streptomyces sp. NPDC096068 TaxID=3155424 RepID=UPI0033341351